ncbi:MAG: transporter [bacterium]
MIRFLIASGCLALFALSLYGMRVGWRHRGERQSNLGPLPQIPATLSPPLLPPLTGLYVGTTFADAWQDRVVADRLGLRAACTATLTEQGLLIDRQGTAPVFVPTAAIEAAGVGAGLAGKVTGAGGLLVVRWRLGDAPSDRRLDTGLLADDKRVYPDWVQAIDRLVPAV